MTYALGDMHALNLVPLVLQAMEQHQVPITHLHFGPLILVYGLDRQFGEVEKYLRLFESSGYAPHVGLYHDILAVYVMARRGHEVQMWLDRMAGDCGVLPKTVLLLARVASRARSGVDVAHLPTKYSVNLSVRQQLFFYAYTKQRVLLADTIMANNITESSWLMTLYCEAGMLEAIEKIRSDSSALKLTVAQYKAVIKLCCRAQRLRQAEFELQAAIRDGHGSYTYLWSPLLCAHCKARSMEPAEHLLVQMTQHKARPTLYIYNSLLRMYLVKGLVRQAKNILERMVTDSITPNFVTALILRAAGIAIDGFSDGSVSVAFASSTASSVDLESLADMDLDDLMDEDTEDLYDAF